MVRGDQQCGKGKIFDRGWVPISVGQWNGRDGPPEDVSVFRIQTANPCVRNGEVEEVTSPQIAVGMFDGTTFSSSSAECMPGDLFALLTDGLIEVFNRDRHELGFDWASTLLSSHERGSLCTGYSR